MILVVLAAGKSERFLKEKYITKPSLLMPGDKTLLEQVIDSFPFGPDDRLVVVGRMSDTTTYGRMEKLLARKYKKVGFTVCWLQEHNGPLDALRHIAQVLPDTGELIISYCDVFMVPSAQPFLHAVRAVDTNSGMVVFDAEGNRFQKMQDGRSFGGIFYFHDAAWFKKNLFDQNICKCGLVNCGAKEVVLADPNPLFYDVKLWEDYIDLGTPEDYRVYLDKSV
jgi:molybdopterin-guanine dinucleotide biosynthesis protein A